MSKSNSAISKKDRSLWEFGFESYVLIAVCICIIALTVILVNIIINGLGWLDFGLLVNYPSSDVDRAGMRPAILGSLYTVGLAVAVALPLGIATGLYLNEYGGKSKLSTLIQLALVNLAGVPSVIFGLVALSFLAYNVGFGRSIITGAIALAFLVLPMITVTTV